MAQRNKGIEGIWKDLQAARNKSAEDLKKEQALEDVFKSSSSEEIMKEVSKSAGTEEELMRLILGLKSGQVEILFHWKNDSDSEDNVSEAYNTFSNDPDSVL